MIKITPFFLSPHLGKKKWTPGGFPVSAETLKGLVRNSALWDFYKRCPPDDNFPSHWPHSMLVGDGVIRAQSGPSVGCKCKLSPWGRVFHTMTDSFFFFWAIIFWRVACGSVKSFVLLLVVSIFIIWSRSSSGVSFLHPHFLRPLSYVKKDECQWTVIYWNTKASGKLYYQ